MSYEIEKMMLEGDVGTGHRERDIFGKGGGHHGGHHGGHRGGRGWGGGWGWGGWGGDYGDTYIINEPACDYYGPYGECYDYVIPVQQPVIPVPVQVPVTQPVQTPTQVIGSMLTANTPGLNIPAWQAVLLGGAAAWLAYKGIKRR